MSEIKRNFLYSSILTTANYIFPLLTYPYISRVLGVNKIGLCNFIDSVINYFILFSMMGITAIGIREIAKYKEDREQRSQIFSSLLILNGISTAIAFVLLIISIYTIPTLYTHKELMFVGVFKLIFNYLLIDWLYRGLENFKYVTIRTLIVKFLYVIFVFILIRKENDYFIYYLLSCLMIVINAILNIRYAKKFVNFSFKHVKIKTFINSFFILGFYTLLTSMYTSFNVAYLGFITNETEVGYHSTATKLYSILLALFSAFTGVLLPRMSSLLAENKIDEFKSLLYKSVNVLFTFSIPTIIISTIMSPEIIHIIAGKGYEGAIIPMRIVMPLMLIIGYEQILVIQTLIPLKKDKVILHNSILGAIVGITMNIILVSTYKSIGSSIVWVISEISVLLAAQYSVTKFTKVNFPCKYLIKNFFYHIPLAICIWIIHCTKIDPFISLSFAGFITLIYCFTIQKFILKNEIILQLCSKITNRHK